ncbi:MAG: T9SS type A sorting domain-containing protein [Bacteroidales bacterium]|nr:T9SS type A sorting domain-containing protein [Bacteroidales bacterium]
MKKYRKQRMLIIAILCVFGFAKAQESVTTTGGNASGSGGSASYSVGQVFYTIATGTNGSVVQGVQQPYEISEVTGIEEAKGINLSISVYPNPTTDCLTLELDASTTLSTQSMSYQLYDINGKLLQSEKITGSQTNIVMSEFAVATYFVKVVQGNKEIKTFKIIKK